MQSEKFWDFSSGNYDKQVKRFEQAYAETIQHSKKYLSANDIVLDFACGTGITTVPLAESVEKIVAIDISQKMINVAQQKADEANCQNVQFIKADIFDTQFQPDAFDAVLAFNLLYFLEDVQSNLQQIQKLLKPGGILISVTDCLGEKKSILTAVQNFLVKIKVLPFMKMYTVAELENEISKSGFRIIESENVHASPPNQFIVAKMS